MTAKLLNMYTNTINDFFNASKLIVIIFLLIGYDSSKANQMIEFGVSQIATALINQDAQTITVQNHEKAGGINFKFDIPKSWSCQNGKRPNVVKYCKNDNFPEGIMFLILVNKIPAEIQRDNSTELSAHDILKIAVASVPEGARLLGKDSTKLESRDAALVEYALSTERLQAIIPARIISLVMPVESSILIFQFGISSETDAKAELKMKYFRPLFMKILNSMVVENIWKLSSQAEPVNYSESINSASTESFLERLSLSFAFWIFPSLLPFLIFFALLRLALKRKMKFGYGFLSYLVTWAICSSIGYLIQNNQSPEMERTRFYLPIVTAFFVLLIQMEIAKRRLEDIGVTKSGKSTEGA